MGIVVTLNIKDMDHKKAQALGDRIRSLVESETGDKTMVNVGAIEVPLSSQQFNAGFKKAFRVY